MARESKAEIMRNVDAAASKIVANNTVEYRRANGERVIRLHQTDIIVWSADGRTVTLNTDGWRTVTTKNRINRFIPFIYYKIYSDRGVWYIGDKVPFFDGIQIRDGKLPAPNLRARLGLSR